MTLPEILNTIAESGREQWSVIVEGPTYLSAFSTTGTKELLSLHHREHESLAVFIPNPTIVVAWGMDREQRFPDQRDSFTEEWTDRFPNRRAYQIFSDVLFYGVLVHREHLVAVDGGNAYLPLPQRGPDDVCYWISEWQRDFVRLLHELSGRWPVDDYVRTAGLEVRHGEVPS